MAAVSDAAAEAYGLACDAVWRGTHPGWPEDDGLSHTSDICRAVATRIFDALGLWELYEPQPTFDPEAAREREA